MLEFRLLGPLEAENDGARAVLGGAKQQALLALLLVEGGRTVSMQRLTEGLWGEEAPTSAAKNLQLYVSQLRKLLGAGAIETRSDGYALPTRGNSLDLARFEELAQAGRSQASAGRPAEAARQFGEALALWRGDALEGLDEPGLAPVQARLDELRLIVHELWVDAQLAAGAHAALLPELTLLARRHPLRERLHEQLMLALYREGRQADALAAFRRLRDVLDEELGLEPGPRLRALEGAILRQDPSLAAPVAESNRRTLVAAGEPGPLAALLEPLAREREAELILLLPVARSEELAAASAALDAHRSEHVRVATFVTRSPERDVLRLAGDEAADLVVLPAELTAPLAPAPCDIVLVAGPPAGAPATVSVLFGGATDDWKGLELATALARAHGAQLRLCGAERGARDASGLLARASLVVQRFAGVAAEPVLFSDEASLAAAVAGGVLVAAAGSSASRARLAGLGVPLLLLLPGPRPGLLAPSQALTLFSWSLA